MPAEPGAYALLIALSRPVPISLRGRPETALPPGRYVYCGSAYGPGGLRARIGRHRRDGKARHWHVDRLTAAGTIVEAVAVPGGSECALMASILTQPGVTIPLAGFGSSDCRACPAHLAAVPEGFDLGALQAALQEP